MAAEAEATREAQAKASSSIGESFLIFEWRNDYKSK